jgi:hypothetical protein
MQNLALHWGALAIVEPSGHKCTGADCRTTAMPFGKRQPTGYCGVERRRAVRIRTDLPAHILLPDYRSVSCLVTDYSPIGARLAVPSAFGLPDVFRLRAGGTYRWARIVRSGVGHVCVMFPA